MRPLCSRLAQLSWLSLFYAFASARTCSKHSSEESIRFAGQERGSKSLSGDLTIVNGCTFKMTGLKFDGDSSTVFWWGKAAEGPGTEVKLSSEVLVLNSEEPPPKTIHLKADLSLDDFSELIARDAFSREIVAKVKLASKAAHRAATVVGTQESEDELSEDLQALFDIIDNDTAEKHRGRSAGSEDESQTADLRGQGNSHSAEARRPWQADGSGGKRIEVEGKSAVHKHAASSQHQDEQEENGVGEEAKEKGGGSNDNYPVVKPVKDADMDANMERARLQTMQQARNHGTKNSSRKRRLPTRR